MEQLAFGHKSTQSCRLGCQRDLWTPWKLVRLQEKLSGDHF